MRIAIVGVGCVGSVYAAHLQGVTETVLVVRDPERPLAEVVRDLGGAPAALVAPRRSTVPHDTDVVLLCVRSDQAEAALPLLADAPGALVVSLTPLLPPTRMRLAQALGGRLVQAMAGAVAYRKVHRVAYYTPKSLPTRLTASAVHTDRLAELVALFGRGGLASTAPSTEVEGVVAATVTALLPILLGVPAAHGSIDAMLDDRGLLELGLGATKECRAIAGRLGALPAFVSMFLSFATPFTIRAGIKLGRGRAPASIEILEGHFGRELAGQNGALVTDVLALAGDLPTARLRSLAARAGALPSTRS